MTSLRVNPLEAGCGGAQVVREGATGGGIGSRAPVGSISATDKQGVVAATGHATWMRSQWRP